MTEENNDKEIIKELREEIQVLKQQIAALQRRNFSSSSEQIDPNQGSLFFTSTVFSPAQSKLETKPKRQTMKYRQRKGHLKKHTAGKIN